MPRYQVPMFLCVDAESAAEAQEIAERLSNAAPLGVRRTANAFLFVDDLLPILDHEEIPDRGDFDEDPADLECAVKRFMES